MENKKSERRKKVEEEYVKGERIYRRLLRGESPDIVAVTENVSVEEAQYYYHYVKLNIRALRRACEKMIEKTGKCNIKKIKERYPYSDEIIERIVKEEGGRDIEL